MPNRSSIAEERKTFRSNFAEAQHGGPVQMPLVPVPAKSAAKQRIVSLQYENVLAYCRAHGLQSPTETDWRNAVEVLTYINLQRFDDTGNPRRVTVKQIGDRAWSTYGITKSTSVVERALKLLRSLGLISSIRLGHANEHTIHFAQVEVVRAASDLAPVDPSSDPSRSVIAAPKRRIDGDQMTDRQRKKDGSDSILLNPPPFQPPPGAMDDGSDWVGVVEEVGACGVTQAKAAVDAARIRGATPEDVRVIVTEWRARRDGWQHREVVLYRRLLQWNASVSPSDGWPAWDEAYQARLDRTAVKARDREVLAEQFRRRRDSAAAREQAAAEWQYAGSFADLIAEAAPELADGVTQARRNAEIRERQAERRRALTHEADPLHVDRVLRRATEHDPQQPRPP